MADELETGAAAGTGAADETTQTVSDPPAFDRAGLETKVNEGLAALFGDEAADEDASTTVEEATDAEIAETPAEETPTDEAIEEASTDEDAEAAAKKEEKPGEKTPVAPKSNAPTLPAAHRRSLKAYGWEDAEIDDNLTSLGEKFLTTAARLHKNRNDEVAAWAEAGRTARQQSSATSQQNDAAQQQQQLRTTQTPPTALAKVDAAKLKEHYGEDALIDSIVGPINAVVEQINAILPAVQQTQQRSQQAEIEMLSRQVDAFFGGKELEPYAEVYGKPGKGELSPTQIATRNKVLETADALMVGAKFQGRTLTLDEAMQLAHDSVSSGFKVQTARTQIKNDLKARQASITLRPAAKAAASKVGGGTRTDLEKKVASGLKAVFG